MLQNKTTKRISGLFSHRWLLKWSRDGKNLWRSLRRLSPGGAGAKYHEPGPLVRTRSVKAPSEIIQTCLLSLTLWKDAVPLQPVYGLSRSIKVWCVPRFHHHTDTVPHLHHQDRNPKRSQTACAPGGSIRNSGSVLGPSAALTTSQSLTRSQDVSVSTPGNVSLTAALLLVESLTNTVMCSYCRSRVLEGVIVSGPKNRLYFCPLSLPLSGLDRWSAVCCNFYSVLSSHQPYLPVFLHRLLSAWKRH